MIRIGTAGWAIPLPFADRFPPAGSGLQRYAGTLRAAEINSSFHRPHRPATYERWATAVPDDFRFAVKLPRAITHDLRLAEAEAPLARFLDEVGNLGEKLGPLLIQLPPSFAFDAGTVARFLEALRRRSQGSVACEPRHPTWFEPEAGALLAQYWVARVAADPARVPEAALPGGWPGLQYHRLHGSPHMYRSEYGPEALSELANALVASDAAETWCVFDNTTLGAAAGNALTLAETVARITGDGHG